MTQFLPPNLLALFAPRDPIPYLPPNEKLPWEKKTAGYAGVSAFLQEFEDPADTPPPTRVETKEERKERKKKERLEQVAYKLEQDLALWDPANDTNVGGDPFKTLFVGRINYDTSQSKLRREFEAHGPVKRIYMVTNQKTGKPRGFAFIEFEHERDMHAAYKHADGKKIDGRRVLVDVERGRTIKGWRPRRLGGGLGGTRKGGPDVNTKYSGREEFVRDESPDHGDMARRRSRSPPPRERTDRDRRRRRSRSRDRRRRSRSKDRNAPDEERRKRRSRSRDRDRSRRSRSRDRKRSRRSRSRDRRRSRSGDRRDKAVSQVEEKSRGSQENDELGGVGEGVHNGEEPVIKTEKTDEGYDMYAGRGESNGAQFQPEEADNEYGSTGN